MKMRDVMGVMILSAVMVGCADGSGSSDMRAVYEKNIQIMDEFSAAMDKATNADEVVAALNRYTREIEALAPQIKALREKHPELVAMDEEGTVPEELKDLEDAFADMGMKMMRAMVKIMQYHEDSAVVEAHERMMTTLQKHMPSEDH